MTEPTDPPRLVDAPSSDPLRPLVEQARADVGTPMEVSQLAVRLAPVIGPAVGPAAGGGAAASGAKGAAAAASAMKLGAAVVIAAAAGGVWLTTSHQPTAARPTADAPVVSPVAAPAPLPAEAEAAADQEVAAPEPPTVGDRAAQPEATHRGSTVKEAGTLAEAKLLGRAQSALSSDPRKALALAEEHRQSFPHGVLVQEREVIAIDALARVGRRAEAAARGERFLKAFPGSAHQSKIAGIVGSR